MHDIENIEEWRDIEGYQGLYQVSNFGRIKSLRNNKGNYREKILRQGKLKNDYLIVNLHKNGKAKNCYVHRLVALAFIENPNNLPTVNHIDENPSNNNVTNLEWMNLSQQQRHGTCIQRRAEKLTNGILSKQVYQYDKDGNLIKIWDSTRECGRSGFRQSNVSQCCRNCHNRKGNNIYKNYIWSYTEL